MRIQDLPFVDEFPWKKTRVSKFADFSVASSVTISASAFIDQEQRCRGCQAQVLGDRLSCSDEQTEQNQMQIYTLW